MFTWKLLLPNMLALALCCPRIQGSSTVSNAFQGAYYQQHNHARQQHLASLDLPIQGRSVLELGAGIGDHTDFFLQRECHVLASDAREEVIAAFKNRYPLVPAHVLDLDNPPERYFHADIVYAYGILYHLKSPAKSIEWMARHANELLLLETCVQLDTAGGEVSQVEESQAVATEAYHGGEWP